MYARRKGGWIRGGRPDGQREGERKAKSFVLSAHLEYVAPVHLTLFDAWGRNAAKSQDKPAHCRNSVDLR